jgi:hypothetical protein
LRYGSRVMVEGKSVSMSLSLEDKHLVALQVLCTGRGMGDMHGIVGESKMSCSRRRLPTPPGSHFNTPLAVGGSDPSHSWTRTIMSMKMSSRVGVNEPTCSLAGRIGWCGIKGSLCQGTVPPPKSNVLQQGAQAGAATTSYLRQIC